MAFSHFLVGYTHSGILMCIAMCIAPAVCWSRLNGFVVELSCSILAPPIEGVSFLCINPVHFASSSSCSQPNYNCNLPHSKNKGKAMAMVNPRSMLQQA
jgi:hypothetical protein